MNTNNGNKILIKLADDSAGSGTPVVLAGQTSGSLSIQKEMLEYTSKTTVDADGVPVRRYIPTRSTSTISITALEDPTGTLVASDILEMTYKGVPVVFAVGDTATGSVVVSGSGFLSQSDTTFDMDAVTTGNFTLQVDGGLTFETLS